MNDVFFFFSFLYIIIIFPEVPLKEQKLDQRAFVKQKYKIAFIIQTRTNRP